MPQTAADRTREPLDPQERISETLFGLIMVLTITGTFSAAESGRLEVRGMLIAALGCNIAWGIIDGILYLMSRLTDQVRGDRVLRAVQTAQDPAEAHRAIREVLPEHVGPVLDTGTLEAMRVSLRGLPPPPARRRLSRNDFRNAVGIFLWVVASVFPVTLPFLFMSDPGRALRVSNGIAVALMFVAGYAYGRIAGRHPWATGLSMVLLGLVLVGLTIALGG